MSDGPYRSLPMSRPWKRAARFAENRASSESEVRETIVEALFNDSKSGNLHELAQIAVARLSTQSLFDEYGLEELRQQVPGQILANVFLDFFNSQRVSEHTAEENVFRALRLTLADRWQRTLRQIEEHYLRRTTQEVTTFTMKKLVASLRMEDFDILSRRILRNDLRTAPSQQVVSNLDEGVAL